MEALLPAYRQLWEPAGAGGNAQRTDRYGDWYADEIHSFLPGTWVIAGHHHGKDAILKLLEAVRRVWTVRSVFHHNQYWLGESSICTEWFSTNGVWNGRRCRNSGLTRHTFAGERAIEWQEYTDSEFFEEAHAGWREVVGPELGRHLSRYARTGPPWYPDPAQNEWPLETSLSDGRSAAPAPMRDALEAAAHWWQAPLRRGSELFSDDVQAHWQGRSWPLGGLHRGRAALENVLEVAQRLWPDPLETVKTELWANRDSVLIHWFARGATWKGQPCRDSGWAVWRFRGGKVAEWRNYVDTSFQAELTGGWRERVGPALGSGLPNWPVPERPFYPDPMSHE
jgi:ketosteroid isomerase-like protein